MLLKSIPWVFRGSLGTPACSLLGIPGWELGDGHECKFLVWKLNFATVFGAIFLSLMMCVTIKPTNLSVEALRGALSYLDTSRMKCKGG
jgi:hypothetical protein